MDSTVLTIVLVVLAAAVIWLVVEVALTVRRVRPAIDATQRTIETVQQDVSKVVEQAQPVLKSVDEALTEARPVVAHVDEVVTQAKPAAADVSPLLSNATRAVEDLSANLTHLDAILSDVSRITGSASSATQAVGAATSSLVDRVRGRFGLGRAASSEDAPDASLPASTAGDNKAADEGLDHVEPEQARVIRSDEGYFTYPSDEKAVRS